MDAVAAGKLGTTTDVERRSTHYTVEHAVVRDGAWAHPAQAAALVAALLLLVVVRWSTRSQYLFDLDSIMYARALDLFDLRLTQPPLPGYLLYIEAARLVRALIGDANSSMVLLSTVLGALLPLVLYALGRELFDRRTAVIAALLGVTGPIFWYQSSFASPRIAEGVFATTIVWLGVRVRARGDRLAFWLLPVALAVAGGVRQQSLMYLVPFAIWTTWRTPWGQRFLAGALCSIGVLGWLVPTLIAAGGVEGYQQLSRVQWTQFIVNGTGVFYAASPGEMLRRLAINLALIGIYACFTCPAGPLLLLWAVRAGGWLRSLRATSGQALLAATVPALLFFAFVHVQQIGHAMAVAPFLALVLARTLASLPRRAILPAVGLVVAANLLFVFFAPARLWEDRIGTPSVATLRARDAFIGGGIEALRAGTPSDTLAIASPLAYGFVEEYAPDYRYLVVPGLFEPGSAAVSRDQRVLTNGLALLPRALSAPGRVALPAQVRRVVLLGYEVDLPAMLDRSRPIDARETAPATIEVVALEGASELSFAPGRISFEPALAPVGR